MSREAIILARWRALQSVRACYRDAGRKAHAIPMRQQRHEADAHLAKHPELIERCAKLLSGAPKPKA
jgi:hypothetical protein